MTFSLLTIAIFSVTAAIIYGQVVRGYKRGLNDSLINLAVIICSAVFTGLLSVLVATLMGDFVIFLIGKLALYRALVTKLGILSSVFGVIIKMLLSLLLYIPIFFVLKAILNIAAKAIMRRYGKKKSKTPEYLPEDEAYHIKNDKKIGACIGVISGFLLAVIVFMPLTGLLKSADDIADTVKEMTEIPAVENSNGLNILDKYANDFSGTVLHACGGRAIYDLTTRTTLKGHTTYLNKEIRVIRGIDVWGIKSRLGSAGALSADNIHEVENILENINESLCLKLLMVEVVRNTSANWMKNEPYFGINRPNLGKHVAIDGFMNSILYVCSTTTIETCDADIRTIINLTKIFQEYKMLSEGADYTMFMKEFVETNGLQRIEDELYKNPHMNTVHIAIDNLIMNVIANELDDIEKYTEAIKSKLYKGLANSLRDAQGLNGSVKMVAISNGVSEHFGGSGVYLPDMLNDRMADILAKNIALNDGNIHESDVKEFFEEYVMEIE